MLLFLDLLPPLVTGGISALSAVTSNIFDDGVRCLSHSLSNNLADDDPGRLIVLFSKEGLAVEDDSMEGR